MSKIKSKPNSPILEKITSLLDERKLTFTKLAKQLGWREKELLELLSSEFVPGTMYAMVLHKIAAELKVDPDFFSEEVVEQSFLLEKIKELLKKRNMSFIELARRIDYSNAGLHRAFSNKTISLLALEKISKELGVKLSYFFEGEIVELLADEILKRDKNPDIKSFILGLSRDLSKGIEFDRAIWKNQEPESYKNGLII